MNVALNGAVTLPGANTIIAVNASQMTATLGGLIGGPAGAAITKNGAGTLVLGGAANSFDSGFVLNAGTLVVNPSLGLGGTPFGTSATGLTYNGGAVSFTVSWIDTKNGSGASTAVTPQLINFSSSNVTINPALTQADFNVANAGSGSGSTILLGTLNSQVGTTINVTAANSYRLLFNNTNLTAAATPATFNVASGATLILGSSGTGFTSTNKPTNIGTGTILFTGNQNFAAPITISTATTVIPTANASTTPLGTGAITLNTGATLTFQPVVSPTTPLTTSRLHLRRAPGEVLYRRNALNAATFATGPAAVINGILPDDPTSATCLRWSWRRPITPRPPSMPAC